MISEGVTVNERNDEIPTSFSSSFFIFFQQKKKEPESQIFFYLFWMQTFKIFLLLLFCSSLQSLSSLVFSEQRFITLEFSDLKEKNSLLYLTFYLASSPSLFFQRFDFPFYSFCFCPDLSSHPSSLKNFFFVFEGTKKINFKQNFLPSFFSKRFCFYVRTKSKNESLAQLRETEIITQFCFIFLFIYLSFSFFIVFTIDRGGSSTGGHSYSDDECSIA